MTRRRLSRPRAYTHVPRTILWLVPGRTASRAGVETDEVESFYLSKWPITNEQLEAFDPSWTRDPRSPGDRDVALGVGFAVARGYCEWYAELSRKPMRLPTETEWHHAALGGATTRFPWGEDLADLDRHAWHAGNSGGRCPHPERKRANGFGLHGMLGSCWEWVLSGSNGGTAGDGSTVGRPVLLGGSFQSPPEELAALRARRLPEDWESDQVIEDSGFRVAKSLR